MIRAALVAVCLLVGLIGCDTRSDVEKAVSYFPADQQAKATEVAECESGGDRFARSPGGSYFGLFQIGDHWADEFEWLVGQPFLDEIYNADLNGTIAWAIWSLYGWEPWSCA